MASEVQSSADGTFGHVLKTWQRWWRQAVVGTIDQAAVIQKRREECKLSARYLLMISMSAGIAILGLLQSSPAVVIGAMLLSPLMDPIMGLGFGLAIGDFQWTRQSAKSLFLGTLAAILFCALIVWLSPLQTVTSEIAARTRPNLMDLGIALFSAVAGAYAMIRGREGTIVGVAIATALMPPLAVVGFGLATFNWTVFSGALMLFVTNLVTIAGTAFLMARLYGFRTALSERQTRFQFGVTFLAFVSLAIPLGISLVQIANEARAQRDIRSAVLDGFDNNARLSDLQIVWDSDPVQVSATVLTPQYEAQAEAIVTRAVERQIDRPVQVTLSQVDVGTGAEAAERAQLAAVQAQEEASARRADELAQRLALIAGVSSEQVVVDRQRRQALVTARPLEGATLSAYRELESRISATEPDWTIRLRPPARPLPAIAFNDEGTPTADGSAAISLIAWAAARVEVPVDLSGNEAEVALASQSLAESGARIRATNGGRPGTVTARWGSVEEE